MRLFALLLLLLPGLAAADRCTNAVVPVDLYASQTSEVEIRAFLYTFRDSGCSSVEYSEWANEMVFTLMDTLPEKFFDALKRAGLSVEAAIIEDGLDHPLHDLINYPKIKLAIRSQIADAEARRCAELLFRPNYYGHIRHREWGKQENNAKWRYEQ